jgi:cytochrome c-type biogenesis protein CcmE
MEKSVMKTSGKLLIFAILAAVGVALIFGAVRQSEPYLTVTQVVEHSDEYQGKVVQVIGVISTSKNVENATGEFSLADDHESIKVVYRGPLPQNFKVGVQAVVVGTFSAEKTLEASNILLKCPSKYADQSQAGSGIEHASYTVAGFAPYAATCLMILVVRSLRKPL